MFMDARSGRVLAAAVGLACLVSPALSLAQEREGRQPPQRDRQPGQQQGDRGGDRRGGGGEQRGGMMGGGMGGLRGMFGGGDPMSPSIDSRELDDIGRGLELAADQKELARGLFEGYQEQFRAKADEMRAKMEEMRNEARESGDRGAFANIATQMNEFRVSRQKMEDQFFGDFKAILTPQQLERWPVIERDRRREKTISRGLMSGERMDVIKLVEQAKFSPEVTAQIKPVLDQYAADLDRELVARNKFQEEQAGRLQEIMGDPERMQKVLEQGRDVSVRVREVNKRYARQIEAALPEEQKAAWTAAVKQASFPDIYRQTGATRQIAAAEGLADLTAEQKETITTLKQTYTRELEAANDKLATAQEQAEMTMTVDRIMRRFGGDNAEDPTADARQAKRDLDRKTTESLQKALTPEQVERLPAGGGPGGGRRGGEGGGNRGGGGDDPRRGRGGGGGG